jgi:hypothetical protein
MMKLLKDQFEEQNHQMALNRGSRAFAKSKAFNISSYAGAGGGSYALVSTALKREIKTKDAS